MQSKVCTTCGIRRGENSFRKDKKSPDGLSWQCKLCLKPRSAGKRRRQMQTRRHQARLYVLEYWKSHPCIDCGETDPRCLEFDHRDPAEKTASVSSLIAKGAALKRIREEISLCDVRCANCHAKRTSDQFSFYTSDPAYVTS